MAVAVGAVWFVAGCLWFASSWRAIGDYAIAELVIRHVPHHVPLSGPYSAQRGFNHPLPWVYLVQGVPYLLSGGRSSAAVAGIVWWNGAWMAWLVWLLVRRRSVTLALVALSALLLMGTRYFDTAFLLPWNPYFAIVTAFVLVFVGWRIALGELQFLPVAAALAMWTVGAHLGFAPFVVPVVVLASVGAVTSWRRNPTPWRGPVVGAVAIVAIMAAPALIDLAFHGSASNPAAIVDHYTGGTASDAHHVTPAQVVKVARAELAIPPAWTRPEPTYMETGGFTLAKFPWLLLIGAVVWDAAWRRRARAELWLNALALAALAGSLLGLLRADSQLNEPWLLLAAHVASAALVVALVWSGGCSIAARVGRRLTLDTWWSRAGIVAFAAGVTAIALLSTHIWDLYRGVDDSALPLSRAVSTVVPRGSTLVVDGPVGFEGYYTATIALQLDRAGYDVRVPARDLYMFTDALAPPAHTAVPTLLLQPVLDNQPPPQPIPNATRIGVMTPRAGLPFAGVHFVGWIVPPG